METWRTVDVACTTGAPGPAWAPSPAPTVVTLAAAGRNTAWPRASVPVSVTPRWSWYSCSAYAVSALK